MKKILLEVPNHYEDTLLSYSLLSPNIQSSLLYWNPCPLNTDFIKEIEKSNLDVMEYIDNIEDTEKIEIGQISLRSPIRLDFTGEYIDKNKDYHPQWHMHCQHKDTRARTKNILSLYSYVLFILENCYPLVYRKQENEEKIESLRKLEKDSFQEFRIGKGETGMLGSKIHTLIGFH